MMWMLMGLALAQAPAREPLYQAQALCVEDWVGARELPADADERPSIAFGTGASYTDYGVTRDRKPLTALEYAEVMGHDELVAKLELQREFIGAGGITLLATGPVITGIGAIRYANTRRGSQRSPIEMGAIVTGLIMTGAGAVLWSKRRKPGQRYAPHFGVQELRREVETHNGALAKKLHLPEAPAACGAPPREPSDR